MDNKKIQTGSDGNIVSDGMFPKYVFLGSRTLKRLHKNSSVLAIISLNSTEHCNIAFKLRPAFPDVQESELYEFGTYLMDRLDVGMGAAARNEILFQTINNYLRNDRNKSGILGIVEKSNPIDPTKVSVRLWNVCRAYGFAYWSEIIEVGESNLRKFRRVGNKAVEEMKKHLESIGLKMKP